MWEKGNPTALLIRMQIDVENSMNFPQKKKKLKMELPHDPSILVLEIYLKKSQTLIQNNTCTSMFTAI